MRKPHTLKKESIGLKKISDLLIPDYVTKLVLGKNEIEKIDGLDSLKNLVHLNLSNNPIKKIEGLNKLRNLQYLTLDNCEIEKIENLDELSSLQSLSINNNKISKLEGLDQLKDLRRLVMDGNKLKNLEGLPFLEKLSILSFASNMLEDIEGLKNLKEISYINLENNEALDESLRKKFKNDTIIDFYLLQNPPAGRLKAIYESVLDRKFSKIFNRTYRNKDILVLPSRKLLVFDMAALFSKSKYVNPGICMYCKSEFDNSEDYSLWLRQKIDKTIEKINRKLPKIRKVKDSHDTLIPFERREIDLFRTTVTTYKGMKAKRFSHNVEVGKLTNFFIPVLPNPICEKCAKDFLNEASKVLHSVQKRGKFAEIKRSAVIMVENYEKLIKKFI
ncbi:MAG: hypothetical protein GF364_07500 [Candidatus Lokiarchaeota archaeon]|nr:hypothetical protein [Candidatus Lokiarchaeota archaeon]